MSRIFGVQNSLDVAVVPDAHEAVRLGHFYRPPIYEPIEVHKVVVVQKGTESARATVDLVMVDANGQKYVCMLTAALLQSIPLDFS